MTIWRDVDKANTSIPVGREGTTLWHRIYAINMGPLAQGASLTVFGKLQGARSNSFDVEYRIAVEVIEGPPTATRNTDPSQHPRTGENIGPDGSDKYVCLSELLEYDVPVQMFDSYAVLWVSARSTAALPSTRQSLSNGYLSVRKHY